MNGKQLIKIGGMLIGIAVTVGYTAYMQYKKQQENVIDIGGEVLEDQSKDDSRG